MGFLSFLPGNPQKSFYVISILTVVLMFVAYLTHLAYLDIDPRLDEVRRALVTLEMMLRDNYWVPTLNGEPYLNKPPLYNWLLALSFKAFGINAFALRLPVIAAIAWFGFLIYKLSSRYVSKRTAVLAALLFMTNGRILIYDSLVGLIDILYSSIVYLGFFLVFFYGKQEKWYKLFIFTYLLVVLGYMMKGLPSLVYQGFALIVFFSIENKWKVLFHRAHFAGIAVMLTLLGAYYINYFNQVHLSPGELFQQIITESTKRTFREDRIWMKDFVVHFSTYPLVFTYHYAPWTLLLLLVVRKNVLSGLRINPFIRYNALLFFACFFIYWLSPYIIARYMFMLLPLCFTVAAFYYEQTLSGVANKIKNPIDYFLITIIIILGLGCLSLPFIPFTFNLPGIFWKSALISLLLLTCGWAALKIPSLRLSFLILAFVLSRFGFNWFVIEQRGGYIQEQKAHANKVMEMAGNTPLYIEKSDPRANFGEQVNRDGLSFIYSLEKGRILPMADSIKPGALYITDSFSMVKKPHKILYRWPSTGQPDHYLVEYPQGNGANP